MRKTAKNELKTTTRFLAGLVVGGISLAGVSAAHAAPPPPPDPNLDCLADTTATFSASPSTVVLGQSTTLSWSVKVPTGCTGVKLSILNQAVGKTGTMVVTPMTITHYELIATYLGTRRTLGSRTPAIQLPTDSLGRPTVTITYNFQTLLFRQAVGTPNAIVRIQNQVELDMTNLDGIRVAPGVQIIGGRTSKERGPRIFTTNFPRVLFSIGSDADADGVRITGVRIEGAEMGIADGDAELSDGMIIYSSLVEIDHCEISGWRGSGVSVWDPRDRLNRDLNPMGVRIHDNYIHHNQKERSEGYGISVSAHAYALIEKNVFDYNRHAIEGHSAEGTGYFAYRNLVLEHGGINNALFNINTHQFDVHGSEDCNGFQSICGRAGEYFDYRYNYIGYDAGTGIKIRGTPEQGADITENTFLMDDTEGGYLDDAAIVQIEGTNARQWNNRFGIEMQSTTPCDFDNDGINDRFYETGETWWYASGTAGQIVYLNQSKLRMNELSFGDVTGDGVCDVTGGGVVYPGGRPAPWWTTHPIDDVITVVLRVLDPAQLDDLVAADDSKDVQGFGDFDGDGRDDVLWRYFDGQLELDFANGVVTLPSRQNRGEALGLDWQVEGVGDYDGDGHADIVWRHARGPTTVWLMVGDTYVGEVTDARVQVDARTGSSVGLREGAFAKHVATP